MNVIHRRYCRSARWRQHVDHLLPWATEGVPLAGARVLELGSGPGQTTDWLATRVGSLTALELDTDDATALARRRPDVEVVNASATDMPLPDNSYDAVVCFTMLHHLPTAAAQDQLLSEARRVLRPGGVFAGSDSRWRPLFALAHIGDTMTLIDAGTLPGRLTAAGFAKPQCTTGAHAVRFRASAPGAAGA
jgi:ubiquinone/menaquinone biosynthesis C-methylase UbiE